MRDLDREFDAYAILMDVAEGLLPLSPLSELAKCYDVKDKAPGEGPPDDGGKEPEEPEE